MSIDEQLARAVTALESIAANLDKAVAAPAVDPLAQRAERQHAELMAQAAAMAPDIQSRTAVALERVADANEKMLALHAAGTPPVVVPPPVVTDPEAVASDDAYRQSLVREQAERDAAAQRARDEQGQQKPTRQQRVRQRRPGSRTWLTRLADVRLRRP